MAPTSVEEIHHLLLIEAAERANQILARESPEIDAFISGEVFRPDPVRSERGGLCLSVDEAVVRGRPDEVIRQIHRIGLRAVHQTLVARGKEFVGLVVGEARANRNYFDRFATPDEQLRLF